ncbi:hypothetical protein LTR22_014636 [Elasticomyces elasticus]|nr:hypothetical protein LTR22_014636 [Elasticomyces elasticus]
MSLGPAADQKAECFMGQYNTSSPNCTAELVQEGAQCQCHGLWQPNIIEDVKLNDGELYRTIRVQPEDWYRPNNTRYLMLLKMPFNYDSVKARGVGNNYTYPHPGLYLAIFDQSLELKDAIQDNYAELIDIDALGTSAINLAVVHRKQWGKPPVFSYIPTVNSIPAMNLACDTASGSVFYEMCTSFLYIRIPNTDVTVKNDVQSLTWTDLLQAYGAYFSVIQLLAWILSGAVTASARRADHAEQGDDESNTQSADTPLGQVAAVPKSPAPAVTIEQRTVATAPGQTDPQVPEAVDASGSATRMNGLGSSTSSAKLHKTGDQVPSRRFKLR